MPTSAATSADADEEVAENVGGGSTSVGVGTEGDRSVASLDLGGDDFVETALQGMGGGATVEPSVLAPMPGVLGDDSSGFEEEIGGGDASPPKNAEVDSTECRHPAVAPTVGVSEDKAEARPPAAPFCSVVYQAMMQRTEDAGAADVILDPLHLDDFSFNFILL